jgi:methylsterol monooxygenase
MAEALWGALRVAVVCGAVVHAGSSAFVCECVCAADVPCLRLCAYPRRVRVQGGNDAWMFAASFTAVHNLAFYGYNGFLYLVQRNGWLQQYKIEQGKLPPPELQRTAWREAIFSHWVLNPVLSYYGVYPMLRARLDLGAALPAWTTALAQLAVFMVCEDTAFYWTHRLLHHRLIYKHVHKRHHEFKYNIGVAAEYDHIAEVFVVFACALSGLLFMRVHLLVFLAWFFLRVTEAVDGHSGYRFPWSPYQLFDSIQGGAQRHEFHHSHNVGAYGSWFCFWDWLMGTDVPYRVYQILQTRDVHRATFAVRTRTFRLDLADRAHHDMATKLHAHALATAPTDVWLDVSLDGRPIDDWQHQLALLPTAGRLVFTVRQLGHRGQRKTE